MVKLSRRMAAVASMVSDGSVLADIGTDHAYVPIYLVETGVVKKAIAMDIGEGPLSRAKDHIRECGMEACIETRLSDGADKLRPGEASSIVIAGMGGELMLKIIKANVEVFAAAHEIILQPQSEVQKVREYFREVGFAIVDEDMILEEGKFYPMFKIMPSVDNSAWKRLDEQTLKVCDIYGPLLIKNGNPILRRFLIKEHKMFLDIVKRLKKQEPTEAICARIKEVEADIANNEAAYSTLGAIKDAGI